MTSHINERRRYMTFLWPIVRGLSLSTPHSALAEEVAPTIFKVLDLSRLAHASHIVHTAAPADEPSTRDIFLSTDRPLKLIF
jgi:hypothetical protein